MIVKLGLYADPHISQSSSIVIGRQGEFTGRLDNLIESFKWMKEVFDEEKVGRVFCLGDMTDRPTLTAEEITAMSKLNAEDHYLIVGNHCRADKSGKLNSLELFKNVYSEPQVIELDKRKILILPYSSDEINLDEYGEVDVILSHNDIKGYDYDGHISNIGMELSDIVSHCKLFINGHLHNGGWVVENRICNLGQLSGMNFSSCGGEWEPSIAVLDLSNLSLKIIPNPVAYRFKKESFKTLSTLKSYLNGLPDEGQYVLRVKVPSKISEQARKVINQCNKVVASRVLTVQEVDKKNNSQADKVEINTTSVYDKLRQFVSLQKSDKYDSKIINEIIDKIETKEGEE